MVISMERNDVVSLRKSPLGGSGEITVRCTSGTVWVTVAGHSTDFILSPGRELTVSRKGKVVLLAHEESSLRIFRPITPGVLMRMGLTAVPADGVCQETGPR